MNDKAIGLYPDTICIDEAANFSPPTTITFSNGDAQVTLDWSKGKLEVKGDLSEGAVLFFEYLKPYLDDYLQANAPYGNLEYLEWLHSKRNGGMK